MRYPCLGSPCCLRTFANGYVLRAHQISCPDAQKKEKKSQQRDEHARHIQFNTKIHGIKLNPFCPTSTGLDQRMKLAVRDRRMRQPADPRAVIIQARSTSMDLRGYYT